MGKDTQNTIHIFKPGRHVAANGATLEFSEADLTASAAAYDPAKHEAPIVIGHPKHDLPAYGWVKSLASTGDGMFAEPHQVDAQFAEMINAGRFKKVSASFYTPDAPGNPVTGVYYLRHVGYLGAQPPAIKGLKQASFAEGEAGIVEFADWADMHNASLWRRMRDWLIGEKGLDEADKVIPDYQIAMLEDDARKETAETNSAAQAMGISYTEPKESAVTEAEKKELETLRAKVAADKAADEKRTADFAEREAKIKTAEDATRRKAVVEFVETLVKGGKVLPKDQAGLVAYMAGPDEAGVIEFGEGDAKVSKPSYEWLREFLTGLPKQVDFSEHTKADGAPLVDANDSTTLAAKAVEFQESEKAAGRTVNAAQAVAHIKGLTA
jgi:hypothetical protein